MKTQEYILPQRTGFQKVEKKLLEIFWRPYILWYTSKKRFFRWQEISVQVNPGVFHPGFFFSTKILLNYIKDKKFKARKVLELGAGSGIISIYIASKGASVLATDINSEAIENIKLNIKLNDELIKENSGIIQAAESDLFKKIAKEKYDYILLNPPFYRGEAEKPADYAWYCGSDLNFFSNLFAELDEYIHAKTDILMILSQEAELIEIRKLAEEKQFELICVHTKKNLLETNFIFRIQSRKLESTGNQIMA